MVAIEERVVVYMDILGSKAAIKTGDARLLTSIHGLVSELASFQRYAEEVHADPGYGKTSYRHPSTTAFSDCIVISAPANQIGCEVVMSQALKYWDRWLLNGFLGRGGATVGSMLHGDGVVFGPALVEAYEIESAEAKYPRIIASNALVAKFDEYAITADYFRRDFDQQSCLAVGNLEVYTKMRQFEDSIWYGEGQVLRGMREAELALEASMLRESVLRLFALASGNSKHLEKICYVARHLNESNHWNKGHEFYIPFCQQQE